MTAYCSVPFNSAECVDFGQQLQNSGRETQGWCEEACRYNSLQGAMSKLHYVRMLKLTADEQRQEIASWQ